MLAREVLRLRGTLASRETEWDVVVDLYFYRDPEAEENKELTGEETKATGADEVGPAAIDAGFVGGNEWEVSNAGPGGAFAASNTAATGGAAGWEAEGADWAASAAAPTQPAAGEASWTGDAAAEGQW